jgi:type IV secretory pathway VirB2 component (pilin)
MRWQPLTQILEDFMNHISKTFKSAWKRRLVSAAPVVAGLLTFNTMAHATVFDSIGNYMYGGFTGPLAKAIAVVIFIISIIGIRHGEGRAFGSAVVAAFVSGAVLAAPLLVNEFGTAVNG